MSRSYRYRSLLPQGFKRKKYRGPIASDRANNFERYGMEPDEIETYKKAKERERQRNECRTLKLSVSQCREFHSALGSPLVL